VRVLPVSALRGSLLKADIGKSLMDALKKRPPTPRSGLQEKKGAPREGSGAPWEAHPRGEGCARGCPEERGSNPTTQEIGESSRAEHRCGGKCPLSLG
jgi:hypothetical protein